ncbi:hypothetical protein HDV00_001494 [Rhizophlyctis rosea]|nr:hypothetical protein HDV00_001494 [Rhizophlyctis rosea]
MGVAMRTATRPEAVNDDKLDDGDDDVSLAAKYPIAAAEQTRKRKFAMLHGYLAAVEKDRNRKEKQKTEEPSPKRPKRLTQSQREAVIQQPDTPVGVHGAAKRKDEQNLQQSPARRSRASFAEEFAGAGQGGRRRSGKQPWVENVIGDPRSPDARGLRKRRE